ncbi:MAG: aldo/keto reductase [Dysgonamonadaceae bacterium]|jgi:aryl-alcohol dehydrogenase-like predicted oxidoreductase|nr:aldo/keto reductase [Dysgonamonadaceae bacterium]
MEYRKIGNTDMEVSYLSFGASSLGGVFHPLKENDGIRAVHTALDNGINFIDVSPYYGHEKAETVLGKAIKNVDRSRFYLSTKVGRYGQNGENIWDYSAKKTSESVYDSLKRLNTDYFDVVSVHDIEFADLRQICTETLPALLEIRRKGLARYIGLTNLTLKHFKYVIDNIPDKTVESVLSFCHYCLNDNALEDYLPYFEAKNIGVINASPFAMGLLTERGAPAWHPAPKPLQDLCRQAVDFCKANGKQIEATALKYSISNPKIATTLFSTTRPKAVLQNIRWAEEPFDKEIFNEIRKILEPRLNDTWLNS